MKYSIATDESDPEFVQLFNEFTKALERVQDKIVFTLDVDGAPFHVLNGATISVNPDRRIIVWLDPTEYDDGWQPMATTTEAD